MTTSGAIQIGEDRVEYWIRIDDEPSEQGINGGRITRLTMKLNGTWDYRFEDGEATLQTEKSATMRALKVLIEAYN